MLCPDYICGCIGKCLEAKDRFVQNISVQIHNSISLIVDGPAVDQAQVVGAYFCICACVCACMHAVLNLWFYSISKGYIMVFQ